MEQLAMPEEMPELNNLRNLKNSLADKYLTEEKALDYITGGGYSLSKECKQVMAIMGIKHALKVARNEESGVDLKIIAQTIAEVLGEDTKSLLKELKYVRK